MVIIKGEASSIKSRLNENLDVNSDTYNNDEDVRVYKKKDIICKEDLNERRIVAKRRIIC